MEPDGRSRKRVVLLNGPPGSGKDTAAKFIIEDFANMNPVHYKFSTPLKQAVHAFLDYDNIPEPLKRIFLPNAEPPDPLFRRHDPIGKDKDKPHQTFFGVTPRNAYIAMSEQFAKPLWGDAILGHILGRRIFTETSGSSLIVVSDSGFTEELKALTEYILTSRILVIQLHRPGCSFDNDSRSYVEYEGVTTVTLRNEHELELFREQVKMKVTQWMETR